MRLGPKLAVALACLLAVAPAACGGSDDGASTSTREVAPATGTAGGVATGLSESEREGIADTLALIDAGGPFPHDQDGATFQNREGLLPEEPSGYYREYTVETPGSEDRGARRLVIGEEGETYYTSDHYSSFVPIDPEDFQ